MSEQTHSIPVLNAESEQAMPELFAAVNAIETAQYLQLTLANMPAITQAAAQYALDVIGPEAKVYGTQHIALRTTGAVMLNRGLTMEDQLYGSIEFDELFMMGWFGGIQYVRYPGMDALCADMFDVTIIEPHPEDGLLDGRIEAPLFVPVTNIETVLPVK